MAEKIEVKVRGGILIAEKLTDPDNPGIALMYQRDGTDFAIDLCVVENQSEELRHIENPYADMSEKDLVMYTFENVETEEWQNRFEILDSKLEEVLKDL